MTIMPLSWEALIQVIESQDKATGQGLRTFYEKCLKYNRGPGRFVPA